MNVLIFGHPGSGKTTHGKYIADRLKLTYLSTGDMVREVAAQNTELGREVKSAMEQGYLIKEDLMWGIIKNKIGGKGDGFLLDGFPRTTKQRDFLENDNIKVAVVFYIHLDHELSHQRLLKRGRTDDTSEKIKKRMEWYRELTKPLIQEFVNEGVPIIHIDNKYTIEEVQKNIDDRLKELR